MKKLLKILSDLIAALIFFLSLIITTLAQGQIPNPEHIYPTNVHLVSRSDATSLQSELDKHKVIRLEQGNYHVDVSISSGCEIYGMPDTKLDKVTVLPGSQGVVLSSLEMSQLIFPAGKAITRHNLFRRINTPLLSVEDARLDENLFLDIESKLQIITENNGYLRNNRFIRTKIHSHYPAITMKGDPAGNSYNNVFLWFNILTPHGDATFLENQKDVTFIGIDAETWNYNGLGGNPLIDTKNLGTLRIFGLGGGSHTDSAKLTQLMRLDAKEAQIYNTTIERYLTEPNINVVKNEASYFFDMLDYSRKYPENSFQLEAFVANADLKLNGSIATTDLAETNGKQLSKFTNPERNGTVWDRPIYEQIKLGSELEGNPEEDHTDEIQRMIDEDGIAILDSGVYYISSPLLIGKDHGIIGRGKGITVIRAKDPEMDMIVSKYDSKRPDYILAELTLEGGKNGIHHQLGDNGTYRISTKNFISHVGFYRLSNAGILIEFPDGRGATFDNNFIDNSYFVECGSGIKQITRGSCERQCSLVDKLVFYQTQFIRCGIGADLQTIRPNHKNAWINCKFEQNEVDVQLVNNVSPLFANCEFTNQKGQAVIKNNFKGTMVVGCRFEVGKSVKSILPDGTSVEGSTLNGENTPVFASSSRGDFYQSTLKGVRLDALLNGMLVNTTVNENEALNKKIIWIRNGEATILVDEIPEPTPQLLFGK